MNANNIAAIVLTIKILDHHSHSSTTKTDLQDFMKVVSGLERERPHPAAGDKEEEEEEEFSAGRGLYARARCCERVRISSSRAGAALYPRLLGLYQRVDTNTYKMGSAWRFLTKPDNSTG